MAYAIPLHQYSSVTELYLPSYPSRLQLCLTRNNFDFKFRIDVHDTMNPNRHFYFPLDGFDLNLWMNERTATEAKLRRDMAEISIKHSFWIFCRYLNIQGTSDDFTAFFEAIFWLFQDSCKWWADRSQTYINSICGAWWPAVAIEKKKPTPPKPKVDPRVADAARIAELAMKYSKDSIAGMQHVAREKKKYYRKYGTWIEKAITYFT